MVKIRSKKFGAAEKLKHSAKRDRGAARGVNKQHHKLKLACSSTPQQKTVQLRDFQQEWFFSDIVGLTDKQAEMMLRRFGVLPKKGGVLHCWQCGERMSQASSSTGADSGDVKQCCNCKVPGRHYLQLRHSQVAWTPFWQGQGCTRGYAPKYAAFLRLCYCLGVRTPPDALPHYVNDTKTQVGRDTLRWWVEAVRYALAYVEMKEQKDVLLKADGASHLVVRQGFTARHAKKRQRTKEEKYRKKSAKDTPKQAQHGRVLVMSGRFSKKTVVRPLPHTVQKRGAPGGGETFREILPLMTRHIESDSVVAASDSGSGLTKAWQALGVPAAQARHGLDEMTPTVSFPSACLSSKQARTVRKAAAVKKKPAAQFSPKKRSFRIVGGDNQCELQIAVGKNQLRRVNALGRMAPRHAHVTLLAARRLLQNPGLRSVLDSLRAYREDRAGKVGCDPAHFADVLKDSRWLFA
ncbi:unnamed protein product [Symbiodinium sp. KB8]|nr:unnamed protein product [Symbiodinium sp. KB8]